jgi:hypothetical protein
LKNEADKSSSLILVIHKKLNNININDDSLILILDKNVGFIIKRVVLGKAK